MHFSYAEVFLKTLVVVQQCSLIAPPEFVDYFKSRIYAVAALINFHSRAAAASNKRVRQKARMLFELLDDDAKFQEERNKCVQSWSEPNPARSPHRTSDSGHESTSGRNRGSPSSALPTPRASPVHDSSDLDPDNERNGNHGRESYYGRTEPPAKEIVEEMVRGATANIPPDVTREKMDQIASCTFDR
ncbi:hypothetical protein JB92DRAFT_1634227 [Gautieria morchelliformis]|nr:hypothetical protein JB92DRAFT_1634227 [Gautieria morchelliformis]